MTDKEYWDAAKPKWAEMKNLISEMDNDCQYGDAEGIIAGTILIRDIADQLHELKEEWLNI